MICEECYTALYSEVAHKDSLISLFFIIGASISQMQATHASAVFVDWRLLFQQSVIRLLVEQKERQVMTEGSTE